MSIANEVTVGLLLQLAATTDAGSTSEQQPTDTSVVLSERASAAEQQQEQQQPPGTATATASSSSSSTSSTSKHPRVFQRLTMLVLQKSDITKNLFVVSRVMALLFSPVFVPKRSCAVAARHLHGPCSNAVTVMAQHSPCAFA